MATGNLRLEPSPVRLREALLYEDEALLVLNKPAHVTSLAERFRPESGLLNLLRDLYPGLKVAHRLDKETTGVLVFTKTAEAYKHVTQQFEARSIGKTYLALVNGVLPLEQLLIEAPIGKDSKGHAVVDFAAGKPSETAAEFLEAFQHFSLVRAFPRTGRTHQVRIHLAYIGNPLMGDRLYGGTDFFLSDIKRKYRPKPEKEEQPLNRRIMLHAAALELAHPETGETMTIEAPVPEDVNVCLKQLHKFDA